MKRTKPVNLALQGGGAHGAFTWGVLDYLLTRDELSIDGLSGTSAGALNASVVAGPLASGNRAGARERLTAFWRDVSALGSLTLPRAAPPLARNANGFNLDHSLGFHAFSWLTRRFSPYELNPNNLNPMRALIEKHVDIETIRHASAPRLVVSATSVKSGQPHVFNNPEMSIDALLATTCLPFISHAVQIGKDAYWDGGYASNPAIWPLIHYSPSQDVILVQLGPRARRDVPCTSNDIAQRVSEIAFNMSLIAEMRAIAMLQHVSGRHGIASQFSDLRLHRIGPPTQSKHLNLSSQLNTSWRFLSYLRDRGQRAAQTWFARHGPDIGKRATLNIRAQFFDKKKPRVRLSTP